MLLPAAALLFAAHTMVAQAPAAAVTTPVRHADRAAAYYHYGLAHLYEDMAVNAGRSDYATQAVEEYKLALYADPNSPFLQDGLADLYFKIGRIREAVTAAQDQVTSNPNDIEAHTLLGKVYLRSLGDMQNAQSGQMLQLAIAEYEKLAQLKPNDVETRLLLGQLYSLNHDSAKAEAQFKAAQKIDANSEEVVLNMARLYSEQGDAQRAADTLSRRARRRPHRPHRVRPRRQLRSAPEEQGSHRRLPPRRSISIPTTSTPNAALPPLSSVTTSSTKPSRSSNDIVAAEPQDATSQIHIAEIQRRQGHYDDALDTLEKAKSSSPTPSSSPTTRLSSTTRSAATTMPPASSSSSSPAPPIADGKYTDPEKANRAIFLDRLGIIYREQNKTTEAVAAYKQMIDLGGDYAKSGYQGEIDAYRDAHMWKEATAVATDAAKAFPKDSSVQLMYAANSPILARSSRESPSPRPSSLHAPGGPEDRDVYLALAQIYIRAQPVQRSL